MHYPNHLQRIDLKLLRYFLAVAEELHFGRAALRLNMSQPPLSVHMKDLEEQLGVALFIRHSRRVELTYAGNVLKEEARRLLGSVGDVLTRIEQIGRGEKGRIAIGVIGTALWGELGHSLAHFINGNPDIEITFHEQNPLQQLRSLQQRKIDVGFWRMAESPAAQFKSICLYKESFFVALPTHHALANNSRVISLAMLTEEAFVTMPLEGSDWDFLNQTCQSAGFVPRILHEAKEPQTLLALVSLGVGITLIPESYTTILWPGVTFCRLQEQIPADIYLVYNETLLSAATSRLLQLWLTPEKRALHPEPFPIL